MKQMVDAATTPIKQAQGTYDAQAQNQQGNVTGLSTALAGILGGIAPATQATYGDAAARQAAFAKGYSEHMQEVLNQNAGNTSSFLQKIGAPDSQVQQVAGQVAPAGASDATYALGGYIPASTLNEEGAAYTAAARQLPATAYSQGLQQIAAIQNAQRTQDATFAQQIGAEGAKAPQYTHQLQTDAFNQAAKTHELALSDQRLADSESNTKFSQSNTLFNQKATVARINLEARNQARQVLQSDRSYGIALANLGLKTAASKRAAIAAQIKLQNGGFTPAQIAEFEGGITVTLEKITAHTDPATGKNTYVVPNKQGVLIPITYSDFVAEGAANGVPVSMVINRANHFFPPEDRPDPHSLAKVLGVSFSDAAKLSGYKPKSLVTSAISSSLQAGNDQAAGLVANAAGLLGTPYQWGGNTVKSGIDCSRFVQMAFESVGITLPRTTQDQVKYGKPVDLNALQPGDLIFTEPGKAGPNHVGLYVGNGQVQESPHTGDVNKYVGLDSFLTGGFVAARRLLGQ